MSTTFPSQVLERLQQDGVVVRDVVLFFLDDHRAKSLLMGKFFKRGNPAKGMVNKKWKFKMAFAIRRRTPLPPPLMAQITIHFLPHFFLLQLNPAYMKRILDLVSVKNITLSPLIIGSKLTYAVCSGR